VSGFQKLLVAAMSKARPGSVQQVVLLHDSSCPALATESTIDCRCKPDFTVGDAGESFERVRDRALERFGGVK
jgi:hypothetical protein